MIESVSRRAFGGSSGTYNVRASELARERKLNTINACVIFLDDSQHCFQIEKRAKGCILLEQVFQHLELVEKDYFGLQYNENGTTPNATNTETTRWLDANKQVKKQAGGSPQVWLAIRFYPPEPSRLAEEYTRYQLCLQLRRLLLDGRISAPRNTALLLASFTVQAEFGDYNPIEHGTSYLSGVGLVPRQTADDERKVRELHKLHRGQLPADAEANFLEHAKRLDCYGVESHPAKDSSGKDIVIGVTSIGLVVFQNNIRINTFSWGKIVKISFKRKQFFIQLKKEPSESYDTVLGFNMRSGRAAKSLWKCSVERHGFFRLRRPRRVRAPIFGAIAALSGRGGATYVGRTECQALEEGRRSARMQRMFVRTPSLRVTSGAPVSALSTSTLEGSPAPAPAPAKPKLGGGCGMGPGAGVGGLSRVTTSVSPAPRAAWTVEGEGEDTTRIASDDEGGFLERALRVPLGFVDDDEPLPGEADGLVVVCLQADASGRYGFNVRGGVELGAPVIVSRVAPATPAHRATPSIQEGDQVVAINGMDVERMLHEQVVQLIRGTKGTLTLTLRPNAVYSLPEDDTVTSNGEEPAVCYVPLCGGAGPEPAEPALRALQQSLLLLADGLGSGAALRRYEAEPRRAAEQSNTASRLPNNVDKNRYKDIAPYDSTRVILQSTSGSDYINASYINMEIPNSDIVLSYIATQGPLPSTVDDFWHMVYESGSQLVVMLTVLTERGRAKCHQYWPRAGAGTMKVGLELTVQTVAETPDASGEFVHREIVIIDTSPVEPVIRHVDHLQYVAWPDHGVPTDARAFLSFTRRCARMRQTQPTPMLQAKDDAERVQVPPPMVVHCSAGVGRTGALILAETAIALIERGQPVYPLDLVRRMREQRPMCIQNVSQYKFVCESIQWAYTQGLVSALPLHAPPSPPHSSSSPRSPCSPTSPISPNCFVYGEDLEDK